MMWRRCLEAALVVFACLTTPFVTAEDYDVIISTFVYASTSTFDVCYDYSDSNVLTATLLIATPDGNSETEQNIVAQNIMNSCAEFQNDMNMLSNLDVELLLILKDDGEAEHRGSAKFLFPDVSTLTPCASAYKVGNGDMLRLSCGADLTDKTVYMDDVPLEVGSILAEAGDSRYYMLLNMEVGAKAAVASQLTNVNLNDNTGNADTLLFTNTPVDIVDMTKTNPTVSTATLDYEGSKVTVTGSSSTVPASDILDMLVYWEGSTSLELCSAVASADDAYECQLSSAYTAQAKQLDIYLVGYKDGNADAVLESGLQYFLDFNIQMTALGTSSLEVGWKSLNNFSNYPQYELTLTSTAAPTRTFDRAVVTCSTDSSYCYGYFTSHDPGTYMLTVKPGTGTDDTFEDTNSIEAGSVTFPNADELPNPKEGQPEEDVAQHDPAQDAETSALVQESQEVEDAAPGGGAGLGQPGK